MIITKKINQIKFKLRENHDFSWLDYYDEVFEVFDQQTSGNICFGVTKDNNRYFIKYAGASTLNFTGNISDAVKFLKKSVQIYKDIRHPNLVRLIDYTEIGAGYMLIYEWSEGESLHSHMKYSKEEKYTNPESPNYRFNRLSLDKKMQCLKTIFDLHLEIANKGYIAVDFYDGSLMYDFVNNKLMICDIDMYQKGSFVNIMGRMWGSSRLMAPEEFQKGEIIDEVTNIYLLGAMAFEILGNSRNKVYSEWNTSKELYEIARKAVDPNRENRFQSIKEFHVAWNKAIKEIDIRKLT